MPRSRWFIVLILSFGLAQRALAASTMVKVSSVVNGNTVKVNLRGQETDIRLFGVATPALNNRQPILKQLGEEAAAFLKGYLVNQWVMLEFPAGQPKADDKGVVDAYVYRGKDAIFVNQKMVNEGLGIANRKVQSNFAKQFIESEEKARSAQKGIWGSFQLASGAQLGKGADRAYLGQSGGGQFPGISEGSGLQYSIWFAAGPGCPFAGE